MKLSILVPVYNEERTLAQVIERVQATPYEKELVVVDDGSSDGSPRVLAELAQRFPNMRVLRHEKNRGKGAALATALAHVSGDVVLIQDADLEYDPNDYGALVKPIEEGKADVVFGSRFLGGTHRCHLFWHYVGNRFLTFVSNVFTNLNLTDMETCYKVFRSDVLKQITVQEDRFGFEPEITAKLARLGCRFYEVGISYDGRGYDEGKKIGLKDALWAFVCILRYGLLGRTRKERIRPAEPVAVGDGPPAPPPVPEEKVAQLSRKS